jgi:hypothetical protein
LAKRIYQRLDSRYPGGSAFSSIFLQRPKMNAVFAADLALSFALHQNPSADVSISVYTLSFHPF